MRLLQLLVPGDFKKKKEKRKERITALDPFGGGGELGKKDT